MRYSLAPLPFVHRCLLDTRCLVPKNSQGMRKHVSTTGEGLIRSEDQELSPETVLPLETFRKWTYWHGSPFRRHEDSALSDSSISQIRLRPARSQTPVKTVVTTVDD
jgi:hypothetical protein